MKNFSKMCLVAALLAGTYPHHQASATWVLQDNDPVVDADNEDDDTFFEWSMTAGADGLRASGDIEPMNHNTDVYKSKSLNITAEKTIGYEWTICEGESYGPPAAQTFTLRWTGNATDNICSCTAKWPGDFSKSEELGHVILSSGDFDDDTDSDKFAIKTVKGSECPPNPADNDHATKSTISGKITIEGGFPPTITGSADWDFVFAIHDQSRTATGTESSDTDAVSGATIAYSHAGATDATNSVVSATASHSATVKFEMNANDDDHGPRIEGRSKVVARTTVFTISKG